MRKFNKVSNKRKKKKTNIFNSASYNEEKAMSFLKTSKFIKNAAKLKR